MRYRCRLIVICALLSLCPTWHDQAFSVITSFAQVKALLTHLNQQSAVIFDAADTLTAPAEFFLDKRAAADRDAALFWELFHQKAREHGIHEGELEAYKSLLSTQSSESLTEPFVATMLQELERRSIPAYAFYSEPELAKKDCLLSPYALNRVPHPTAVAPVSSMAVFFDDDPVLLRSAVTQMRQRGIYSKAFLYKGDLPPAKRPTPAQMCARLDLLFAHRV